MKRPNIEGSSRDVAYNRWLLNKAIEAYKAQGNEWRLSIIEKTVNVKCLTVAELDEFNVVAFGTEWP